MLANQESKLNYGSNFFGAFLFSLFLIYLLLNLNFDGSFFLSLFKLIKISIIIYLFLNRHKPSQLGSNFQKLTAYISTIFPMLYTSGGTEIPDQLIHLSTGLFIVGELLSVIALIALGNSFGVSPAKRPFVQQGPYKYLKHPIYIGYFLSELSVILLNFSEYNLIIFLISTALYFYRAILENKFHYGGYPKIL